MKKMNSVEMKKSNGGFKTGWTYISDSWLGTGNYRSGDKFDHNGHYRNVPGGWVAYRVYYRPGKGKYRTA